MSSRPLAVVMPVHNAAPYLDTSINSILRQTFDDFEFIVLDDASTDGSADILASWAARDGRLRVERSTTQLGLVGSSNVVVRASRAPLVARMDADDVSHPERLAKQVEVLRREPGVVLVGTLFEGIDRDGRVVHTRDRWRLLRRSPFAPFPHGSVVFRRSAFEAVGGYAANTEFWEDLSLFHRLAECGRVLVLPEALYSHRYHPASVRLVNAHCDVEGAVARMWQRVRQREVAGDGPRDVSSWGDAPLVAYSLAAQQLWAGNAPELLSRLRLRWLLPPRAATLGIFAVATMAAFSPRATRSLLGRIVAVRDWMAGFRVESSPFEWHFT